MTTMTPSDAAIDEACRELSQRDGALARAYVLNGPPPWRARPPGYETLARTIAYQQISTKAAASIWDRFVALMEGDVCHNKLLETDEDTLRSCGLSRPKVAHLTSIANAMACGDLDLSRIATADDDDARAELLAVKGIGPWTADIYLMYSLGRMDAFPAADLGLIESYRLLRNDEDRIAPKAFNARAEGWRPYRAVAALQLWTHINLVRDNETGGAG